MVLLYYIFVTQQRLFRHITMKDLVIFIFIVVYRSGKGILKAVFKLVKTIGHFMMTYLFSGSLIELAKETTISGFIEAIPEPTQDGIGSRFEDEPEEDVEEESTETEEIPIEQVPVLASAFGIDIRADGTAAFSEYVDDRVSKFTGFGDQDFDESLQGSYMDAMGKIYSCEARRLAA